MARIAIRRMLLGTVAIWAVAGLAFATGAAAAEEAPAASEAAAVETESGSSDGGEQTPAPKSEKSESAADEPEASDAPPAEVAELESAQVSGPGEWEMDGETYLDDPSLTPGDPVPEADVGTAVTPKYKHDETDLTGCVPPQGIPDYCSHVLGLDIDDDPKVVSPGEWLTWWITVTNLGTEGYHEHNVTVTDWVPDNVYFDTFSLEFWDSSEAGIDAADFDCTLEDAAAGTKTCRMDTDDLDQAQWIRFLATGQVMWSADPGDSVVNVVQASSLDSFGRTPTVVEITPIAGPTGTAGTVDVTGILPVTGSSTMTLLLAGLGIFALGGLGLGATAVASRRG